MRNLKNYAIKIFAVGSILASLFTAACSNHWREVSTGYDSAQVGAELQTVLDSQVSAMGPQGSYLQDLIYDNNKQVYFTESSERMGPVHTIMPLDFFVLDGETAFEDLVHVSIFFVTRKSLIGGHEGALIINYYTRQAPSTKRTLVFINDGSDMGMNLTTGGIGQDDDFRMTLVNTSGGQNVSPTITVFTDDLNENQDDLASDIQLNIYDENRYLGKISVLEGF